MKARIGSDDLSFLRRFSEVHKNEVMQRIMSRRPEKTVVMDGDNEFEKTLIRLRRDGYGLIDLQPQEAACSSVWYRRKPSLLKRGNEDIAMVLWETTEAGQATTLITWQM